MSRVYLSLGSNMNPATNIVRALQMLGRYGHVAATSTIWQTRPIGMTDQPDFLNGCVILETNLWAGQIQDRVIPSVEKALARQRGKNKFGPRSIDVDIMLYEDEILDLDHRHIPSPEIYERAFVAVPLAEIAPDYVHPETGEKLAEIAGRFSTSSAGMTPRPDIRVETTGISGIRGHPPV